jgi:glutamate-1-semialdehyde 2,1-aminomutase
MMQRERNDALVERARRVIPGGMYGHMSVQRMMPKGYPQFFERAQGARLWDVDGNEYIDFMCAFGPMILGYRHAAVEAAVDAQRRKGDTMTGPSSLVVELAERFVAQITHADWAIFAKNGTDATTLCCTLARAATGKRKLLVAKGAYHGAAPWCTPSPKGVIEEDRSHLLQYEYNDVASLTAAVERAHGDLAGIVVSAFKHDAFVDQALPTREFAHAVRRMCDTTDAALILDEVRAGFRLSLDTSWSSLGVEPDLSAWSKAIANGYALAAILGKERFREAATKVYATGSFWFQALPMAAGLATLTALNEADAPTRLNALGERLRTGLHTVAQSHGLSIRQTGPAAMPMVLFDDDPKLERGNAFCSGMLERGIYMHPWHNMFLSTAHTESDIDHAVAAADSVMATI